MYAEKFIEILSKRPDRNGPREEAAILTELLVIVDSRLLILNHQNTSDTRHSSVNRLESAKPMVRQLLPCLGDLLT